MIFNLLSIRTILVVLLLGIPVIAQEEDFSIVQDIRGEHTFNFKIHPRMEPFRFVVKADSEYNAVDEIAVYKSGAKKPLQVISIDGCPESPVVGVDYFTTADFNFDGYKDIMLLGFWGATGNRIYMAWVFNPSKMRFETNEFLQNVYLPEFDYKRKEFTTLSEGGFGEYDYTTYKYKRGRYIVVKERSRYFDNKSQKFIEDTYTVKNGKKKLVKRTEEVE